MKRGLLPVISLLLLIGFSCRKAHVRKHYEGNFRCSEHYTYSDINGNYSDTTYSYDVSVMIFEEYEYDDGERKSVPIKILENSGRYLQTEVFPDGHFKADPSLHGNFEGGYTNDNNFHYVSEDGGLGSHYKSDVTAVRQ